MSGLAFSGLLAVASAHMGAVPPDTVNGPAEIVVTGAPRDAATLTKATHDFVQRLSGTPVQGQYARWNMPLCPKIVGLDARHAAIVLGGIRTAADHAGVVIAPGRCRPNMVVAFVADAKATMTDMVKADSGLLRQIAFAERPTLTRGDAAVRWWYATEAEGADGRKISASSPAIANMSEMPSNGESGYLDSYHSSLIDTKLRVSLTSVAIVVDVPRATGVRLDALSAYIAFVGLTRIPMTADFAGLPTILTLFSGPPESRAGIAGMTAWDRAYLSGLYRTPASRPAHTQRSLIAGRMRTALGR